MDEEWIAESWCIFPVAVGVWGVGYGDTDIYARTSVHRGRRRAKKEITHYIVRGAARGPAHGIYRYFDKASGQFV